MSIERGNRVTSLPDSICELTELNLLWLNGNQLTELPTKIANISRRLGVAIMSPNVGDLYDSCYIMLGGNPWSGACLRDVIERVWQLPKRNDV